MPRAQANRAKATPEKALIRAKKMTAAGLRAWEARPAKKKAMKREVLMLGFSRILVLASIAMVLPSAAMASALVDSVSGTVEVGGATAIPGQRVFPGRIVTTGADSQLTLTFDDRMQLVLGSDTELRIVDFRYAQGLATDRAVFDLTRGSLRVVTGTVARRGETAFSLRTPQASFAVRSGPADFTVALVNPAYLSVGSGQLVR